MTYNCGICGTITEVRVIGGDVVCNECGSIITITEDEINEHVRLLHEVYGPKVIELMQSKDKVASIIQYVNTLDSINAFLFGISYCNFCENDEDDVNDAEIIDLENGMKIGMINAESTEEAIRKLLERMFHFRNE